MRNLKKVLSLTLALVMMLGMMTFAGAAEVTSKDMTDMDKVVNKEAVSLLIDLGIINGIKAADGTYTFNPAGNIERGAYAKMIYAVMMANGNADVYKGVNTGLNDVKGHWAEGFIGYCVSTKIAAGNGNGTFTPNANITVVAGAKMLLTALGYDAKASGYENDALWSINIMRDAQAAGLMDSIAQAAGDTMTRDTAAQLIYNALFAKTVTPKFAYDMGVKYLDEYREGEILGLGNYKLAIASGVLVGNEQLLGTTAMGGKSTIITEDGSEAFEVASSMLDIGKTVTFAVQLKSTTREGDGSFDFDIANIKKVYSANVTASSKNKVVALDAGMNADDDAKSNSVQKWLTKNNLVLDTTDPDVVINLTGSAKPVVAAGTSSSKLQKSDLVVANNTKAYAIDNNGDKRIDYLVTSTKTFSKVLDNPSTKNNTDDKLTVKVPGIVGSYTLATDVVGYEGLKKDDYVLVLRSFDGYVMEKASSFVGQLTGTKGSTATISGKTYEMSGAVTLASITAEGYNKDVTYWTDENGNITLAKKVSEDTKTTSALMLGFQTITATWAKNTYQAMLLFADGTTQLVDVANGADLSSIPADFNATAAADYNNDRFKNLQYVEYSVNKDGKYDLTLKTAKDAAIVTNGSTITTGVAAFTSNSVTHVANANTVFIVAQYKSNTASAMTGYKTYTGIANIPTFTDADYYVYDVDGVAKMVFITTASNVQGATKNYAYVLSAAAGDIGFVPKTDTTKEYYTFDAMVNGEKVVLKTTETIKDAVIDNAGLYEVQYTDGIVTAADSKIDEQTETILDNLGGGVISIDADSIGEDVPTNYTIADDAKVYIVDGDQVSVVAVTDVADDFNDLVFVETGANATTIKNLYIVKVADAAMPAPLTLVVTGGDNVNLLTAGKTITVAKATTALNVTSTPASGTAVAYGIDGHATDTTDAAYTVDATDKGADGSVAVTVTIKNSPNAPFGTLVLNFTVKFAQ